MGWFDGFNVSSLTANSRWETSNSGYCTQSHTLAELINEPGEKKAIPLCKNDKCKEGRPVQLTLKSSGYSPERRSGNGGCFYCGHAVFWTEKYLHFKYNSTGRIAKAVDTHLEVVGEKNAKMSPLYNFGSDKFVPKPKHPKIKATENH